MRHDRYLTFILTVIALELLWIGLRDTAPAVSAQARPAAAPVVITGVDLAGPAGNFLPVAVVGSYREVPAGTAPVLRPMTTRVEGSVSATLAPQTIVGIRTDRPLKVEADRPLPVREVVYTPGERPGEE